MAENASSASDSTQSPVPAKKTYDGNCHCGLFKFRASLPPLKTTPLHYCQCSICLKKGYLFVFPNKSDIVVEKGGGEDGLGKGVLQEYRFNSKQFSHRFCPTCGTPIAVVHQDEEQQMVGFNVRTLRDIDVWEYDLKVDANSHGQPYEAPSFPDLKKMESQSKEGEKIMPGSCHCGAVTFVMQSKPLDDPAVDIKECDCSQCMTHSCILTYPSPLSQVSVHFPHQKSEDASPLQSYLYTLDRKWISYDFCGVCGCHLFLSVVGPDKEDYEKQDESVKKIMDRRRTMKPVNIRALDFFLARTEEEKAERQRVEKNIQRERGSQKRFTYVVPEPGASLSGLD